ncbi:MAG TPA: magnesium/cobalt transporter CorA [Desulfosarcina sp.]|nr:magnesium/cobalt transporter CorA [Desulfosarcina sp.]
MPRLTRRTLKKVGSAPGTLVHVGEQKTDAVHLSLMHYHPGELIEHALEKVEDGLALLREGTTTWINIDGIHDVDFMEHLGKQHGIHPLTLEDVLNTTQRPKAEVFDDYLFVVLKMLHYDSGKKSVGAEQVSLIVGPQILVSFQEAAGDVFEPVRERIRKGKGRIRGGGSDYLAYALIDAVVDNYFVILDHLGQRLEEMEAAIDENPTTGLLATIHTVRQELIYLRRQVWPLRDVIAHLLKEDSAFIGEATRLFVRDVYDHTVQIIDTIESFRDVLSSLQDLYLSMISNRMNEVMKVLTIIATTFIPITFIAGVYGMNFQHMPELAWRWGYPAAWGAIVAVVAGMLTFFRRRKWL